MSETTDHGAEMLKRALGVESLNESDLALLRRARFMFDRLGGGELSPQTIVLLALFPTFEQASAGKPAEGPPKPGREKAK